MKFFLVGVLSLVAGILLGRHFQPAQPASAATPARPSDTVAAATPASPSPPASRTFSPQTASESVAALRSRRLEALRWLTDAGMPAQVPAFFDSKINPTLARLLELNANEAARLTNAYAAARREIDNARAAGGRSYRTEDGTKLLVDVPILDPALSGRIYDRFIDELDATIGSERLAILRQLSGENVERSLDRFGLNPVRYELNLKPVAQHQNEGFYNYTRHHIDATGMSTGSTEGRLTLAQIQQEEPVLAKFLPAPP